MAEDAWDDRDQKLLDAIAEAERDLDRSPPDLNELTMATGLDPREVERGAKALFEGGLIDGATMTMAGGGRVEMSNITLRKEGRRASGQWPSENHFERLIEVLDRAVAKEEDEEKANLIRGFKTTALSTGSVVLNAVLAEFAKKSFGL